MHQKVDTDVIIVGAGPVGLTAAVLLGREGVRCRVLEAESAIGRQLKASTFHPPTLEMLDEIGVANRLIAEGAVTPTWQVRMHETHERAEFDLDAIRNDTRYPFRLQCEQWRLSEALVEMLGAVETVDVAWNTRVTGIEQSDDAAVAIIDGPAGSERLQSKYLVGADGARSVVRDALGISFEGSTYPEQTILATTRFAFEDHLPRLSGVNYIWHRGGTFSLLRLPDLWRCSLYPDEGQSMDDALEPASIEAKLQRIVARDDAYDVLETRPYRIHRKVADTYRVGRALLAGDAAHLNSPSGGMGMNGGIHDAWFLAKALSAVLREDADPRCLDDYSDVRRDIASDEIVKQADANRSRMQQRDPEARRQTLRDLQAVAADPERCRARLLKSSMIDGIRRAREQLAFG